MMEQENKLPGIILLEVDPYEFMGNDNTHDVQNLKYYYHRSDTLRQYINALSPFEKYKFYIDLYRFNGRTINVIHNYLLTKQQVYPGNGYEMFGSTKEDSVNTLYSSQSDVDHPELILTRGRFGTSIALLRFASEIKFDSFVLPRRSSSHLIISEPLRDKLPPG